MFDNSSYKSRIGIIIISIILFILIPGIIFFIHNSHQSKKVVSYSATSFKDHQKIITGSTITGTGIPNSKVSISITPNGLNSEVNVDKNSQWRYTLPENLKDGNYNLTIFLEDIVGNPVSIKTYPIVVNQTKSQNFKISFFANFPKNLISLMSNSFYNKQNTPSKEVFSLDKLIHPATVFAQNSCSLQPGSVQYDCSNGKQCFNDYDVDSQNCTYIPRSNDPTTADCNGNTHCHCIDNTTQCGGLGTGWTGNTCSGTYCQSNSNNCGSSTNPSNRIVEDLGCDNTNQTHLYRDWYRDQSTTDCKWVPTAGQGAPARIEPDLQCQTPVQTGAPSYTIDGLDHDWLNFMHHLDLYPVKDVASDNDIIFISRDNYIKTVCSGQDCVPRADIDNYIATVTQTNDDFIRNDFANYIKTDPRCFIPEEILSVYFNDLTSIELDGNTYNMLAKKTNPTNANDIALYSSNEWLMHPALNCTHANHLPTDQSQADAIYQNLLESAAKSSVLNLEDPYGDFIHGAKDNFATIFPFIDPALRLFAAKSSLAAGYSWRNVNTDSSNFSLGALMTAALLIPPEAWAHGATVAIAKLGLESRDAIAIDEIAPEVAQGVDIIKNEIAQGGVVSETAFSNRTFSIIKQSIRNIPVIRDSLTSTLQLALADLFDTSKLTTLFGDVTYTDSVGTTFAKDGVLTKIVHPEGYAPGYNLNKAVEYLNVQAQLYGKLSGACRQGDLIGLVFAQNSPDQVLGLKVPQQSGHTLHQLRGNTIIPSLDKRLGLISIYDCITSFTGLLGGNLLSVNIAGGVSINPDSILVSSTNDFNFLNYANGDTTESNPSLANQEPRALIKNFFIDGIDQTIGVTPGSIEVGNFLISELDQGITLHQALEDYQNNPLVDHVVITHIDQPIRSGGNTTVDFTEDMDGVALNPNQLVGHINEDFWIRPANTSNAGFIQNAYAQDSENNCPSSIDQIPADEKITDSENTNDNVLTIPANLQSGSYTLFLAAHTNNSNTVSACTSIPIKVETTQTAASAPPEEEPTPTPDESCLQFFGLPFACNSKPSATPEPESTDTPSEQLPSPEPSSLEGQVDCPFFWQTRCPITGECLSPGQTCEQPQTPTPPAPPSVPIVHISPSPSPSPHGLITGPYPDLQINNTSLSIDVVGGGNIAPGKSVSFRARVDNTTNSCIASHSVSNTLSATFTVLNTNLTPVGFFAIGNGNIPLCNSNSPGGESIAVSEASQWVVSGPGTYTVRVCADSNAQNYSPGGAVYETNEFASSNCTDFPIDGFPGAGNSNLGPPQLNDQSGIADYPVTASASCDSNNNPKVDLSFDVSNYPFVSAWRTNVNNQNDTSYMFYSGKLNENITQSDPISITDGRSEDGTMSYQNLPQNGFWADTNTSLADNTTYLYTFLPNALSGVLMAQGSVTVTTPNCHPLPANSPIQPSPPINISPSTAPIVQQPTLCPPLNNFCTATNQCQLAFLPCQDNSSPNPSPSTVPSPSPKKQILNITINGQEIYPNNSNGIDLDLKQNTAYLIVINYIDETGLKKIANRSLIFQKPVASVAEIMSASPTILPNFSPSIASNISPSPICRSIDCPAPQDPSCSYQNAITHTCDPSVILTCGNLICIEPPAVLPSVTNICSGLNACSVDINADHQITNDQIGSDVTVANTCFSLFGPSATVSLNNVPTSSFIAAFVPTCRKIDYNNNGKIEQEEIDCINNFVGQTCN